MSLESAFVLPRSAARRAGSRTTSWDVAAGLAPPRPDDDASDDESWFHPLSRDLHLRLPPRHAGLPGARAARVPAPHGVRLPLSRRRHRRWLATQAALVLAPAAQRRRPESPPQGAQGDPGHLRAGQPRRGGARLRRDRLRRHCHSCRGRPRDPPRRASARDARRPVRRGRHLRPVARVAGRPPVHVHPEDEPALQCGPRAVGPALLVALAVPEAAREERGELHRLVRGGAGARSPQPGLRRRRMRSHSSRGNSPDRRHPVLQLRRLGGEPDGVGGGAGRDAVDRAVAGEGEPGDGSRTAYRFGASSSTSGHHSAAAPATSPSPEELSCR